MGEVVLGIHIAKTNRALDTHPSKRTKEQKRLAYLVYHSPKYKDIFKNDKG
jgi:hypothetical protein